MTKIKVSYATKVDIDFGLFPDGDGEIEVDRTFWTAYIQIRQAWEETHATLMGMLSQKYKDEKLNVNIKKSQEREKIPDDELLMAHGGIRKGEEENSFYVKSQNKDQEYMVDLNGETCTCPAFKFRMQLCKHIKFAESVLGETKKGITGGEADWFDHQEEASFEDMEKVLGEKRIRQLVDMGEIFVVKPGFYKRLK